MLPDEQFSALAARAVEQCEILARYSEDPAVLTRTYLSAPMREVHREVNGWMQALGMEVRVDAIGNIVGRLPAEDPGAPVFLTGSHLDTVPNAGKYDGILGVTAGLSLVAALRERPLSFHLDVIGFAEEEGVRFRTPYLGSRALAGTFDPGHLELTDDRGVTLAQAIAGYGGDPGDIQRLIYDFSRVAGFIELHIEQGPVLESRGLPVAAVSAIAGQHRVRAVYAGTAGHAGTTPMDLRRDAFPALAELSLFAESLAGRTNGLFATVGFVEVLPGARNVIPGRVTFTLDIRHGNQAELDRGAAAILAEARRIAENRGLELSIESEEAQPVVECDPIMTARMHNTIARAGGQAFTMISGAGHDTAVLAKVTPSTMLFIRTPGGISHNPIETVDAADLAAGLKTLVVFFQEMDLILKGQGSGPIRIGAN